MKSHRPYIIAELSANHSKNMDVISDIVIGVANSGASAIKLQTFTADQMTIRPDESSILIPSHSELWAGKDLWELMREAELPLEWHIEILNQARSLGLDAFSTAYHPDSVDFLLNIGVDALKVSSFDVINHPLLKRISVAGIPVIMSTGMASLKEIDEAVELLIHKVPKLILLKCTSAYPCADEDANVLGIKTLQNRYGLEVGFSDHTLDSRAANLAYSLGATVFEKHVKLESQTETLDSAFSATPTELAKYVDELGRTSRILGSYEIEPCEAELASLWERPSVVALSDIRAGEIFSETNIGIRRPSIGLHPKFFSGLLGARSTNNYKKGDGIRLE
jgi:sialic acid synthase SpsE